MNKENRKKVLAYVNKHGKDVGLRFGIKLYVDYFDSSSSRRSERIKRLKELKEKGASLTLRKVVLEIIELSQFFGSRYIKAGREQCCAGARRTCIDIWRMCNYYKGVTDIFDVMHTLYEVMHDSKLKLTTSYCSTVRRRTFRNETSHQIYNADYLDEFGLAFSDWKNI